MKDLTDGKCSDNSLNLKILDEKQKVFGRRKLLTKNKLEFKSKTSNKEFDPGSG